LDIIFVQNGISFHCDRNSKSEDRLGFDDLYWHLHVLEDFLDGVRIDADKLSTRLVWPVCGIFEETLHEESFGWVGGVKALWLL